MLTIDLTSNQQEFEREVSDVVRRQLPFAMSLTLNSATKDVRRYIVGTTWKKAFTVRNHRFPGVAFKIKFSRKTDLTAELFDSLERDFVLRHAQGGTKRPHSGKSIAIPVEPDKMRTATGRIRKNLKPRSLTAKKSTRIIRGKSGKNLIIERYKGETVVRYVLSPSADIKKSFKFYQDAEKTFWRVLDGHWNTSLRKALRTRKNLDGF